MEIIVKFATRLRGFFRQLASSPYLNFKIEIGDSGVYEVNSKLHGLKVKLVRSKLATWLGIIQRIKFIPDKQINIVGSYNRFLDTTLPYFIYVENPTALYHYTLGRNRSFLGRKKLKSFLHDPMLKGIVYMCKACQETFPQLVGLPHETVFSKQIYPLVKSNPFVKDEKINSLDKSGAVKFLYISQGSRFYSKGGMEVINSFISLSEKYPNISLTIVTNLEVITQELLQKLSGNSQISLFDFKLSADQMQKLYSKCDVLLQPTSDDSCSLTILEALHSGLAFIASSLYSIPEIVEDGENGFLVEPHYWFFSKGTNLPNPEVWNHRKKTIYSGKVSKKLIDELKMKMTLLIEDPLLLKKMKLNSWNKAHRPPFSEEFIADQWNKLIDSIAGQENHTQKKTRY